MAQYTEIIYEVKNNLSFITLNRPDKRNALNEGIITELRDAMVEAEAAYMRRLFAGVYDNWAANVPLFIPRATPYRNGLTQHFDLRQYLRHREYRAAIGLAIVIAVLSLK